MGMENHNSIYVCCQRHKRPFIEKEIRRKYKNTKIVSDLKQANELSILIEYQDIDILPEHTKRSMINARASEDREKFLMDELE